MSIVKGFPVSTYPALIIVDINGESEIIKLLMRIRYRNDFDIYYELKNKI